MKARKVDAGTVLSGDVIEVHEPYGNGTRVTKGTVTMVQYHGSAREFYFGDRPAYMWVRGSKNNPDVYLVKAAPRLGDETLFEL